MLIKDKPYPMIAWPQTADALDQVSQGTIEIPLRTYSGGGDFRVPVPGSLLVRWRVEELMDEYILRNSNSWKTA